MFRSRMHISLNALVASAAEKLTDGALVVGGISCETVNNFMCLWVLKLEATVGITSEVARRVTSANRCFYSIKNFSGQLYTYNLNAG